MSFYRSLGSRRWVTWRTNHDIDAGLDECFTTELDRVITPIAGFPATGKRIRQNERRLDLTGFPFAVIYRRDADRLVVLAVSHHRRDPDH